MRTNIDIDDELMEKAKKVSGLKTKKDVVEEGLKKLIEEKSRPDLRELRGKFKFADDFDYRKLREGYPRDFD